MGYLRTNKMSKEKLRLYKLSLSTYVTDEVYQKYASYRNKYNKLKYVLRFNYYNSKCIKYKNNIKQLWKVIHQVIGKINDKTNHIDCIKVDTPWEVLCRYRTNFCRKNTTTLQINFRIYR